MIFSPLDEDDVVAVVGEGVGHLVLLVALVPDMNLIAGCVWSVDPDKEDVAAGPAAVHAEGVVAAHHGAVQTRPFGHTVHSTARELHWDLSAVVPG